MERVPRNQSHHLSYRASSSLTSLQDEKCDTNAAQAALSGTVFASKAASKLKEKQLAKSKEKDVKAGLSTILQHEKKEEPVEHTVQRNHETIDIKEIWSKYTGNNSKSNSENIIFPWLGSSSNGGKGSMSGNGINYIKVSEYIVNKLGGNISTDNNTVSLKSYDSREDLLQSIKSGIVATNEPTVNSAALTASVNISLIEELIIIEKSGVGENSIDLAATCSASVSANNSDNYSDKLLLDINVLNEHSYITTVKCNKQYAPNPPTVSNTDHQGMKQLVEITFPIDQINDSNNMIPLCKYSLHQYRPTILKVKRTLAFDSNNNATLSIHLLFHPSMKVISNICVLASLTAITLESNESVRCQSAGVYNDKAKLITWVAKSYENIGKNITLIATFSVAKTVDKSKLPTTIPVKINGLINDTTITGTSVSVSNARTNGGKSVEHKVNSITYCTKFEYKCL
jgi:hypothetical protein